MTNAELWVEIASDGLSRSWTSRELRKRSREAAYLSLYEPCRAGRWRVWGTICQFICYCQTKFGWGAILRSQRVYLQPSGAFRWSSDPPGGVVEILGDLWYGSLNFNLKGLQLPPVDVDRSVAELPDSSSGLLLFDIFIMNQDRHAGNFAVDFAEAPPLMNVFDFSHALLGHVPNQGASLAANSHRVLGVTGPPNRHALLDIVKTDQDFEKWINRIKAVPDFLIDDLTEQAMSLGINAAERDELRQCLKFRRDNLKEIIKDHSAEFNGIKQWSLIW